MLGSSSGSCSPGTVVEDRVNVTEALHLAVKSSRLTIGVVVLVVHLLPFSVDIFS